MTNIVAAIANDPLISAIHAVDEGADMIEIRIDLMNYPADSLSSLFRELSDTVQVPIIATNRMQAEGGGFTGSEKERIRKKRHHLIP